MDQQIGTLVTFGLIFLFIYFLMVRPQKRARQEHQRLVDSIETGDEIMTTTGIFGTVTSVGDEQVTVEIAPGTQIRMLKRAIHSRIAEELGDEELGEDDAEREQETEKQTENA